MAKSFFYVREFRGMPWIKRGTAIEVSGKKGRVTSGGNGGNIRVRLDGEKYSRNYHPHWETVYYDKNGKVIADYR